MDYNQLKLKGRVILNPLVSFFGKLNIPPSSLTITGVFINCFVAYLFSYGFFRWAGFGLIFASIFDAIDGAVARKTNKVTSFGGFLDSVMDRYSEFIVFLGIFIFYIRVENLFFVFVTFFAFFGSIMVSYARARAEGINISCKVGIFDRTMRITTMVIGALIGKFVFGYFLLIIAIFTQFTSFQRIFYVKNKIRNNERRKDA
ncbi:MAG: hypothetical protein B5M53_01340 [Candidatus Cloacimonas sp. 4484_209]|nr:MAG: hypothetical protein B5M53_01340 [Candidatus Cloacimonas sp. 4484_209]